MSENAAEYRWVPTWAAPLAPILVPVEIVLALTLVGDRAQPAAALAAVLLAGFAALGAAELSSGRSHACGCFGRLARRRLRWSVVIENALLSGGGLGIVLAPAGYAVPFWSLPTSLLASALTAVMMAAALYLLAGNHAAVGLAEWRAHAAARSASTDFP